MPISHRFGPFDHALPPSVLGRLVVAGLVLGSFLACDDVPTAAEGAISESAVPPEPTQAPPPSAEPALEKPPDEIAAQHVLITYRGAKQAPKTVKRTKLDAKKLADEVQKRAKAGEDFTGLVREYSEDEGSKGRMGSLGKFKREKMVKPFSDVAFLLELDEVSDVTETEFGFHVIKRNQ